MEQSPAATAVAAPSQDESSALEALKKRIADASYPTLSLARDLQNHMDAYGINKSDLAQRLDIQRPILYQWLRTLQWPEPVRINLDHTVLSYREIQAISALKDPVLQLKISLEAQEGLIPPGRIYKRCEQLSAEKTTLSPDSLKTLKTTQNQSENTELSKEPGSPGQLNTLKNAVYSTENTLKTPENTVNSDDEEDEDTPLMAGGKSTGGFPLIRYTIDEVLKLLSFWRYKLKIGRVVELWLIRARETGWFMTGFIVVFSGFSIYGFYQGSTEIGHKVRDIYFRLQAQPGAGGQGSMVTGAPRIVDHDLLAGNRLQLTWTSAGPAMSYRVYYHPTDSDFDEPVGQEVSTLGAIVDVSQVWKKVVITVTSIAPNGAESPHSNPITFILKPENQSNTVTPLEQGEEPSSGLRPPSPKTGEGRVLPSSGSGEGRAKLGVRAPAVPGTPASPSAALALPIPTEVHYELKTANLIVLRWRPVGPQGVYTYNVYSSAKADLSALRKENTEPMKLSVVTWTPETGLDTYWVVVTALDAQGHESGYSEAIQVVRHPEKSDHSALIDQATGAVRKVLPW